MWPAAGIFFGLPPSATLPWEASACSEHVKLQSEMKWQAIHGACAELGDRLGAIGRQQPALAQNGGATGTRWGGGGTQRCLEEREGAGGKTGMLVPCWCVQAPPPWGGAVAGKRL